MSSDSSDDEDLSKLREATDSQFISDAMYKENVKQAETIEKPPSLRCSREDDDEQFNFFRVTPEFRNYVAKQLTSLLDKSVVTVEKHKDPPPPPKKHKHGIKLLHSSTKYIKVSSSHREKPQRKTPALRHNEEEINEEDLKSIAVDAEFIKHETTHWSRRSKAPIYSYKLNKSGELEEI